jgi:hypothetical protein
MGKEMSVMELVDNEISLVDWAKLKCGCSASAAHLPADLYRFFRAQTRDEALDTGITEHVFTQSFPHEPAPSVASVLMAGLASDIPLAARVESLDLLLGLVDNEDADVSDACVDIAREGLWGLYAEVVANRSPALVAYAYQILQVIEPGERLHALKASGKLSLPSHLRD